MFVFALGLTFTACSDDDDDVKTEDYAKDIAATYAGKLAIPGLNVPAFDKDLSLVRTGENKIKMELKDLSIPLGEGSIPVGDIAVDNVPVTKAGDTYTLKETTATVKVKSPTNPEEELNAKVTVSGTQKAGDLNLTISVKDIDVPNLDITYTGKKK